MYIVVLEGATLSVSVQKSIQSSGMRERDIERSTILGEVVVVPPEVLLSILISSSCV